MTELIEKLTPITPTAENRCFGCGVANPTGLQLEFFLSEDGCVVCFPAIPERFEGSPGYVHGGVIATLLDETMAKSVRARGVTAVTGRMEVEYLRPVHSGTALRLEGRLMRSEGRRHWTEARMLSARGHVLAAAKGCFVELRSGHVG
jgi:uncharacterized protein (TIGR00369 family)